MLRIKEARQRAGLLQKNMAKELGIDPSTLHGYESGKHTPTPQMLRRIADICGVTVDYLVGAEEDPFSERFRERAQLSISWMNPADLAEAAAKGYPIEDINRILEQSYPLSLAEACILALYIDENVGDLLGEKEDDYADKTLDKILQDPFRWLKHSKKRRNSSDKSKKKEMFEQKYNALTPAHKKIIDDVISAFLIQQKKSEE